MGYAIEQLSNLPFENIIGGPMTAAIKAQSLAAKETIGFIKEVGFKPAQQTVGAAYGSETDISNGAEVQPGATGNAEMGEVRNVTFTYKKTDGEGIETIAELIVPILTIVPIPFLRIDELNIDFTAKISETIQRGSQHSNQSSYGASYSGGYSSWWSPWKASFSASYSSKHSSSSSSSSRYSSEMTMNVNLRAVQDELPAGLSKVLGILEGMIKEKPEEITTDGEVEA
ncbi:MAG: DUF2589 domain-containing protein [Crocinitomicaceae bacterium]|nr:DUF2589 domain-containing protein [Crocinitomicaceae bacterium]